MNVMAQESDCRIALLTNFDTHERSIKIYAIQTAAYIIRPTDIKNAHRLMSVLCARTTKICKHCKGTHYFSFHKILVENLTRFN